jgi:hypothetical protein
MKSKRKQAEPKRVTELKRLERVAASAPPASETIHIAQQRLGRNSAKLRQIQHQQRKAKGLAV